MSTLGMALLGLLAQEPLSGYELSLRMKKRVSAMWEARHSQIYPELQRLEAQGLVQSEEARDSARQKKLYRPTKRGLDVLRAWLVILPEPPPARDELVLKAFLAWLVPPKAAAALLRAAAQRNDAEARAFADNIDVVKEAYGSRLTKTSQGFFAVAVLKLGVERREGLARWCRWLADELDRPRR